MELNADSFDVVQDVDQAFVEPVAMAYKKAVPSPIRSGLRNFLRNLGEPVVFLNFLLQLKPGKAFETLGRFTINSTIGIGGVLDVAKKPPFYLPHRSNGFANTFGYYGIEQGAFLFLPLVGPTTVRDLVGNSLNLLFLPTVVGKPFTERAVTIPIGILNALDSRIELDEQIAEIRDGDADPYTASREFYLNKRQTEIDILRGRLPDPLSRKSRGTGPAPSPEAEPDASSVTSPLAPDTNSGVSHPVDALEAETGTESATPDPSSFSEEPLAPDLSRAPATRHFLQRSGALAGLR
jgi:phospholipid-binding lipoprotein MlaA